MEETTRVYEEQAWVSELMKQTTHLNSDQESDLWKKQSIFKVPTALTRLNAKAYQPQIVSFGPYHHGQQHLQPMEQHKHRALLHFLKRTNIPVQAFLRALREVEQELKDSYEHLEEPWLEDNCGEFLRLMLCDGCFMLEILRTAGAANSNEEREGEAYRRNGYAANDPIFSLHGEVYTLPFVKRDMLMLENQIPLLVLERLLAAETDQPERYEWINRHVLGLWSREWAAQNTRHNHVLDVFHNSMTQIIEPHLVFQRDTKRGSEIVRSATDLYEAGVRFKKSMTDNVNNVYFANGVLVLPVIVVDDATESMLLNLMAFERSHVGAGNVVTSYAFFMDHLIDSARDVNILQSSGIIKNALGSDKAVAELFNGLSLDVPLDPRSELHEIQSMVNEYCKKRWNVWRANLVHTYFRSPWALISLFAAIFLLILTVLQTLYSILAYY